MRVVTVDAPGGEYAFSKTILTRTSDVIHDLLTAIFNNCFSDSTCQLVQHFIPAHPLPFSFASFARAFERIENTIGIGDLIQRGWTLGAISATRARMLGVAFELLYFARGFVDV